MGIEHGCVIHKVLIPNGQLIRQIDMVCCRGFLKESLQILISVSFLKLGLEALVRVDGDELSSQALLAIVSFFSGCGSLPEKSRLVALEPFIRYLLGNSILAHEDLLLYG